MKFYIIFLVDDPQAKFDKVLSFMNLTMWQSNTEFQVVGLCSDLFHDTNGRLKLKDHLGHAVCLN